MCMCVCFVFVIVVLVADLKGRVFLLTGARIKIGFQVQFFCLFPHIAIDDARDDPHFVIYSNFLFLLLTKVGLKLLRSGATLIATTRFPSDALLRYAKCTDFAQCVVVFRFFCCWHVVGIQVATLCLCLLM